MASSKDMIQVSHLSRRFGTFQAVDDVSFSIQSGQIVGLLGPNGAGKTTTMRMITGFLEPTSGEVTVNGLSVSQHPVAARRSIGYMSESAPLYSDMLVLDYLTYVAGIHGCDPLTKVPLLAEQCGLLEVMHKSIGELSRGYRQRVGLAHALMNDPEILILDEPTSGLDPNQISDVRALIKEIGKTRTVIISTHILGEVEMLCDRVLIISRGKLVADSPTKELRETFGGGETVRVTAGGISAEALAALVGEAAGASAKVLGSADAAPKTEISDKAEISSSENAAQTAAGSGARPGNAGAVAVEVTLHPDAGGASSRSRCAAIAQAVVGCGCELYELSVQKNSLEDVFHALTQGVSENTISQGNN